MIPPESLAYNSIVEAPGSDEFFLLIDPEVIGSRQMC